MQITIGLPSPLMSSSDSGASASGGSAPPRSIVTRDVRSLVVVWRTGNGRIDYTFDPALFSESEEARTLDRKLWIPPGPNNPVGVAWIGLDLPGYGIHGTPTPEHVGRTESHGCFRLANWDARTLLGMVWVGMPVTVEP